MGTESGATVEPEATRIGTTTQKLDELQRGLMAGDETAFKLKVLRSLLTGEVGEAGGEALDRVRGKGSHRS